MTSIGKIVTRHCRPVSKPEAGPLIWILAGLCVAKPHKQTRGETFLPISNRLGLIVKNSQSHQTVFSVHAMAIWETQGGTEGWRGRQMMAISRRRIAALPSNEFVPPYLQCLVRRIGLHFRYAYAGGEGR